MAAFFLSDIHLRSESEPNSELLLGFLRELHRQFSSHQAAGQLDSAPHARIQSSTQPPNGPEDKASVIHAAKWISAGKSTIELESIVAKSLAAGQTVKLVLVGDIFDLWIADHEFFQKQFPKIIAQLKALKDSGVEIHYFEGNHDLHLDGFWQNRLGIQVHKEPTHFVWSNVCVRVEHGDQMNPDDRGYLFLRWFLRLDSVEWLAKNLPGNFVAWIGKRASLKSRDYTSSAKSLNEDQIRTHIRRHVEILLEVSTNEVGWHEASGELEAATSASEEGEFKFDFLIAGHVHIHDDQTFYDPRLVRSINLGSWFSEPRVFVIEI